VLSSNVQTQEPGSEPDESTRQTLVLVSRVCCSARRAASYKQGTLPGRAACPPVAG
jgi:hypothetical protein